MAGQVTRHGPTPAPAPDAYGSLVPTRKSLGSPPAELVRALAEAKARSLTHWRYVHGELEAFDGDAFSRIMSALVQAVYPRRAAQWNTDYAYHRYLSIVRMMTRTLAVMAHRPPETWLVDGDGFGERLPEDHPQTQLWRRDERALRFPTRIKAIDRATVLHRTVVVSAGWVKGGPRWQIWRPHRVRMIQDPEDPGGIADAPAVFLELPQPTASAVGAISAGSSWWRDGTGGLSLWSAWWRDGDGGRHYTLLDQDGTQALDPGIGSMRANGYPSPYGRHPLTVWRDDEPGEGEFWLPARESWWAEQRWVCRMAMQIGHVCDYQGFGVPLLRKWGEAEDQNPTLSPGEPVRTMDPEADLQFRTPVTNLPQLEAAVENGLRRTAIAEGLPAGIWSIETAARNLAALKLDRQYLDERREDHVPDYDHYLDDTFLAHVAVCNAHRDGSRQYGADVRLRARWLPVPLPVDEYQHSQMVASEIRLGLRSPVEELRTRQPTLTREEAEKLYERNLEDGRKLTPEPGPPPIDPALSALPATPPGGNPPGAPRSPDVRDDDGE